MSKDTIINGRTYSFGTIPAVEAVRVEVAIARVIGEPLFKAFMETKAGGTSQDTAAAGATAVGLLMAKMDADELLKTMETVFTYVSCDGKRVNINETFTGKNYELWEVFIEALRCNFSDFFPDGLLASLPVNGLKKSLS